MENAAVEGDNGKEIALFSGCLIPTKYQQAEIATNYFLSKLGVKVRDIRGFSCCPDPIFFRAGDTLHWLTQAARNLSIAENSGVPVISLCSGCNTTLRDAHHVLSENSANMDLVNENLKSIGLKYSGKAQIKHIIAYIRDNIGHHRISYAVTRKLTDLKIAPFYGCHILKPSNIMKFDSIRFPSSLNKLIEVLGAEAVNYPKMTLCCGKGSVSEEISLSMIDEILSSVSETGADCICVVCPYCYAAFEQGQMLLARGGGKKYDLPVLFYTELAALAFGASNEEAGLGLHRIKTDKLTSKTGISGGKN
ncbi:MAG: CoB--CoM heterodisulfide reductase iron-sulfur subunit B family protein [Planctomycetota bacterium]